MYYLLFCSSMIDLMTNLMTLFCIFEQVCCGGVMCEDDATTTCFPDALAAACGMQNGLSGCPSGFTCCDAEPCGTDVSMVHAKMSLSTAFPMNFCAECVYNALACFNLH